MVAIERLKPCMTTIAEGEGVLAREGATLPSDPQAIDGAAKISASAAAGEA
jgi:high-affinity K+ transport system ATPase subunit B